MEDGERQVCQDLQRHRVRPGRQFAVRQDIGQGGEPLVKQELSILPVKTFLRPAQARGEPGHDHQQVFSTEVAGKRHAACRSRPVGSGERGPSGPPRAAGLSRGISSSGGGGIGVWVNGARASATSAGVW